MVQDNSSSNETPKDEPDVLDLKANPSLPETERPLETPAADRIMEDTPASPETPETSAQSTSAGNAWSSTSASAEAYSTDTKPAIDPVSHSSSSSSSPSTSALIGAGILGGLIALAAAGSMQYAGYLPGMSGSGDTAAEMTSLRSEVDGLKQQLSTIPTDLQPSDALEKRLAALEAKAGAEAAVNPQTQNQIKTLEDTVAELKSASSAAAGEANAKLSELGERLASAEKTLKDQPGEAAVSRAIAATYLKAAVDRGDPFLTELQTFSALSPEDPAIAGLKPLAATGIKSKATIAKDFDEAAKAMSEALNQPVQGESMTDRLLASARSLISVRPVGNVEGNDWGAVLARMEDKLRNGDIKGAALEWDGLPEAAKAVSKNFKAELDARATADDLTRGMAERNATPAVNAG